MQVAYAALRHGESDSGKPKTNAYLQCDPERGLASAFHGSRVRGDGTYTLEPPVTTSFTTRPIARDW